MLTSPNVLLGKGMAAVAFGLISIIWPGVTLGAVVGLFAAFSLFSAVADALRAFASDSFGPVLGWLALSLLSATAAVVALAWPGITVSVLAVWIGLWAAVTGIIEIGLSFGHGETAGQRTALALSGAVGLFFALALFMRPDAGAVALATVFGVFAMFYGISAVSGSFHLRHLHGDGRPAA
ncbi:HdeD family acid-resistance protein [Catenulispora yoronensis]